MPQHEKIDYVELASNDLSATKAFFKQAFGWEFEDFGSEYTAFANQGVDGGFYKADLKAVAEQGSALVVFYSADLEQTQSKVSDAGGVITQAIFSFPGGRRFHFTEPAGNEFAVWTDKGLDA